MTLSNAVRNWAIENDDVTGLCIEAVTFEQMAGMQGVWLRTSYPAEVAKEAAYMGLVMRRKGINGTEVQLMNRGRLRVKGV